MSAPAEKLVLDLETKKSFAEVNGRNLALLGVSVVGIYSYRDKAVKVFLEKDIAQLRPYLQRAELIIGFNIKSFDYAVLQPYVELELAHLNTLDIFEEVRSQLGFRLGLNSLAQATLNLGKIGSGMDALMYFRQGRLDKLIEYCAHDVSITRQLYEYGQKHAHLLYYRGRCLETIPVSWAEVESIDEVLLAAFEQKRSLEIEYASTHEPGGSLSRQIDIYDFAPGRVIAFCHLRQELRTFNIRRILAAKITSRQYTIPAQFSLRQGGPRK